MKQEWLPLGGWQKKWQSTWNQVTHRNVKGKVPPVQVVRTIDFIRSGVSKFSKTLVPPPVALFEMITASWTSQAIAVTAKFGVADHIAPEGTAVDELAEKVGANADALYRVLRALSAVGVVVELEGRRFKLTAVGKCLRSDHPQSVRHMAIFQGFVNWANWGALDHCVETGKNAVEKVFGEKPFEHFAKHPEKAEIFDRAMTNVSTMENEAILAAYDFSNCKTLADVGGGHGKLLSTIMQSYPQMKGILFDLPHVVKGAKSTFATSDLKERIEIQAGSFFDNAPTGADTFIMKHIIHDWSDEESIRILKNIRGKIPADGRLVIVETIVPERNVPHFAKFLDLEMLVVTTGRERTEEEYRTLFEKAGFRLSRVVSTVSLANVLEAVPV